MKLDRNITNPRRGKYALIKLRDTTVTPMDKTRAVGDNLMLVIDPTAVDFGDTEDSDFFVIRLKDKYAEQALMAYALAALADNPDDPEYGQEIAELARLAASHPNKRKPD